MSDFKAKMHQIRFRLGLRPTPRWGNLQRSPRPPSWIKGSLLLRGRGNGKGVVGGREGSEGNGRGKGEGRGGQQFIPQCSLAVDATALVIDHC